MKQGLNIIMWPEFVNPITKTRVKYDYVTWICKPNKLNEGLNMSPAFILFNFTKWCLWAELAWLAWGLKLCARNQWRVVFPYRFDLRLLSAFFCMVSLAWHGSPALLTLNITTDILISLYFGFDHFVLQIYFCNFDFFTKESFYPC